VFKSFKSYFSKACSKYLAKNPGVVITTDKLAALVAEAWPNAFSVVNIMSGFKKTGVYPLNPGEVNDHQLAPSKALLCPKTGNVDSAKTTPTPGSPLFSPEQEALYQKRFDENYDISDPSYVAWLKINHPEAELSVASSVGTSSSSGQHHLGSVNSAKNTDSSDILSEVLVLPEPKEKPASKRKPALTKKTLCLTEDDVLENLRKKESEKKAEEEKKRKQLEQKKKGEKAERKKKSAVAEKKRQKGEKQGIAETVEDLFAGLQLAHDTSSESDDAVCPKCGLTYSADNGLWICCDECNSWYNLRCANIRDKRNIPDVYYCEKCV